MSKTEQEWAEEVEELKKKVAAWEYRAAFWLDVAVFLAEHDGSNDAAQLEIPERLRRMVVGYVSSALASGQFRKKMEFPSDTEQETTLPWPLVLDILAEINIDGNSILVDFINDAQESLQNAMGLAEVESLGDMPTMFVGEPITAEMAQQILKGEFGEEFEQQFADKYLLHVMHPDRPCQHPYDSIDEAIEAAAFDLRQQKIVSVGALTRNGMLVLSEQEVQMNVDRINNAGMN